MSVQLPPEAMGGAIGTLVYTVVTLLCSVLLFFLAWIHERFSCEYLPLPTCLCKTVRLS